MSNEINVDSKTVEGFGDEWERFDQSSLAEKEQKEIFESYFSIFPWHVLPENAEGFDLGCGSGRWAKMVAPKVGRLHCIDPSAALDIARKNLAEYENCEFHHATVDAIPIEDSTMDFGYSLGVFLILRLGLKIVLKNSSQALHFLFTSIMLLMIGHCGFELCGD